MKWKTKKKILRKTIEKQENISKYFMKIIDSKAFKYQKDLKRFLEKSEPNLFSLYRKLELL